MSTPPFRPDDRVERADIDEPTRCGAGTITFDRGGDNVYVRWDHDVERGDNASRRMRRVQLRILPATQRAVRPTREVNPGIGANADAIVHQAKMQVIIDLYSEGIISDDVFATAVKMLHS